MSKSKYFGGTDTEDTKADARVEEAVSDELKIDDIFGAAVVDEAENNKSLRHLDSPDFDFYLQDVLHIVTNRMLSSTGDLNAIYELLGYMTGYETTSVTYPNAMKICKKALEAQHEFLKDSVYQKPEIEDVDLWLRAAYRKHGQRIKVRKLAPELQKKYREMEETLAARRKGPKKPAGPQRNDSLLRGAGVDD